MLDDKLEQKIYNKF